MTFEGWGRLHLLCAFFAAMTNCTGLAYAQQGAFRDPGPPPAAAESVPTIEQAKTFFLSQVDRYGAFNCAFSTTTGEGYQKVSIVGKDMTINYRDKFNSNGKISTIDGTRLPSYSTENKREESVNLEEVDISYYESSLQDDCKFPYYIMFKCIKTDCVNRKMNTLESSTSDPDPTLDSKVISIKATAVGINDALIAKRMLKAITFYKSNLPAEISPF